jgi:hypothetical protein
MKRSQEQRRAEMIAEASAVIDELLEWEKRAGAPNLTEMEDEVLELRQRLGQRMLESVIEDQEERQPAVAPRCGSCGEVMRYKGQKGSEIETRLGELEVERGYYHCTRCESGFFPPQ